MLTSLNLVQLQNETVMLAFQYCQNNRSVVKYLRNRNRTVLSDVFQSHSLTSKQNCHSLFIYAIICLRRVKESFNAIIEEENDCPVQAAASWFLRQVTGAGPVFQLFDKSNKCMHVEFGM